VLGAQAIRHNDPVLRLSLKGDEGMNRYCFFFGWRFRTQRSEQGYDLAARR
jgi:hypothetical protein